MTVTLLAVNAVLFLVTCLAYGYPPEFPRDGWWALNLTDGFSHLLAWQFLTYQFVHGGLMHLLLNSWIIYTFGREVEATVGRRRLLAVYLCSGLGGSLAQLGAAGLAPELFSNIVVGASASGLGLLATYAWLFPDRRFVALVMFILPVSVRARFLLGIATGLALLGIATPADHIAHAAHLGGILTGMAFARFALRGVVEPQSKPATRPSAPLPQGTVTFITAKPVLPKTKLVRTLTPEPDSAELLRQRVDLILDKIHAQGMQSLTPQEREVLERARQRMIQR